MHRRPAIQPIAQLWPNTANPLLNKELSKNGMKKKKKENVENFDEDGNCVWLIWKWANA